MRIQFLGTAAAEGWPALFCRCAACEKARALGGKNIRTRSQALVDGVLLLDFPPDTYLHMLHGGLRLPEIRDVLITHTHIDHLFLSDLAFRGRAFAGGVGGVLTLHGNDRMAGMGEDFLAHGEAHEQIDGRVAFGRLAPLVPVAIAGYRVTPLPALHDPREVCYLYKIEKDGKALLYGNDTGYFPEETWRALAGVRLDLVSLDCTMLCHKDGRNHMGIEDACEVRARLMDIGAADGDTQFVLTHFSHNGELLHAEIEARVRPLGFTAAYDGLEMDC